jgi:hypothetical protein
VSPAFDSLKYFSANTWTTPLQNLYIYSRKVCSPMHIYSSTKPLTTPYACILRATTWQRRGQEVNGVGETSLVVVWLARGPDLDTRMQGRMHGCSAHCGPDLGCRTGARLPIT